MFLLTLPAFTFSQITHAISYQKISLNDDTIRIQALGTPTLDIQLLENTDQCLVNCHTTLKITPYQNYIIPSSPTENDKLLILDEFSALKSYSFEILTEVKRTVENPIYKETPYDCSQENSTEPITCIRKEQTGTKTEIRVSKEWKPFSWFGETLKAGQEYTIRINGKKIP